MRVVICVGKAFWEKWNLHFFFLLNQSFSTNNSLTNKSPCASQTRKFGGLGRGYASRTPPMGKITRFCAWRTEHSQGFFFFRGGGSVPTHPLEGGLVGPTSGGGIKFGTKNFLQFALKIEEI